MKLDIITLQQKFSLIAYMAADARRGNGDVSWQRYISVLQFTEFRRLIAFH